jgi:hypothetical protein
MNGPALLRVFGSRMRFYFFRRPDSELKAGYYVRDFAKRSSLEIEELEDYYLVNVWFVYQERMQSNSMRGVWEATDLIIRIICDDYPFSDGFKIGDIFLERNPDTGDIKGYTVRIIENLCPQSRTAILGLGEVD